MTTRTSLALTERHIAEEVSSKHVCTEQSLPRKWKRKRRRHSPSAATPAWWEPMSLTSGRDFARLHGAERFSSQCRHCARLLELDSSQATASPAQDSIRAAARCMASFRACAMPAAHKGTEVVGTAPSTVSILPAHTVRDPRTSGTALYDRSRRLRDAVRCTSTGMQTVSARDRDMCSYRDVIRPRDAHIRCCRRAESANVISTSQPSPRQYTWKTFCGAKPRNARDRKRRITREPSTSRATLGHPRTGQGPGEMDTGQINERERNGRNRAPYCSTRSYP